MAGPTQLRLASIAAAAYGALALSGIVYRLQRSGSLRTFVHELARPSAWLVLVVAFLVAWGLWRRAAWAWWLGIAGACWEIGVIVLHHARAAGLARLPRPPTLLALGLLLLVVVLLLQRRARAAASR